MSAQDAQSYWISRRIPTDQFLLYCFAATPHPLAVIGEQLRVRACAVADLRIRVREVPGGMDLPHWVPMDPAAAPIRLHAGPMSWGGCREAVAALLTDRLDATQSPWRLHLFGPVAGAPECGSGDAVVAVLQVAHALGDGRRASAIARDLFAPVPPAPPAAAAPWRPAQAVAAAAVRLPIQVGQMLVRARPAYLGHQRLVRDTAAGVIPAAPPSLPKLLTNAAPDGRRAIATVVVDADTLRGAGSTVTVGAMTAISMALTRYLRGRGADPAACLAAEVTVAKPGRPVSRNHFRNVAVDLHPRIEDPAERAAAIAESLRRRRLRADHPSGAAEDRVLAAVPAPLLRHGVEHFDFTAVPDEVTGNTVVSSVDRGPDDLTLGGGRVRFTAGFPALSQFMGLTHGVHGMGGRVTISVVTSPAVLPDLDGYVDLLRYAVRRLGAGRDRDTP
ncbi:WS/DGAT domain-containing protein [Rhodococcus sp. NPDC058505]|uniref:WS/DGAT domain-containing protein n=1 Tax=unclassified Rhodococcus (in: high G+C Gram-positive bacteria) TaxID=192944 RepID=UPI003649685B